MQGLRPSPRLELDATILRDAIVCTQYPEHQDTLWTIHHLATCTRDDGRLQDAEKLQRETLVIRRRILGPEHPDTLGSMEELAVILDMLHRYTEAAELYRRTIEVQRRILGRDHPVTASTNTIWPATLLLAAGVTKR